MERNAILKAIKNLGWVLGRHGTNHDIWIHPEAGSFLPVPRGKTIHRSTARYILRFAKKYLQKN